MSRTGCKIVSVSDYFGPGPEAGGAGASALRIALTFHSQGALARMIAGFKVPDTLPPDIDVRQLGGKDLRGDGAYSAGNLARGIWNWDAASGIREALRGLDRSSTIISLHQWTRWISPAGLRALSGFKKVVFLHDYFWLCPTGAYFDFQAKTPCTVRPLSASCIATACDRAGQKEKLYRTVRGLARVTAASGPPGETIIMHISETSKSMMQEFLPQHRHYTIYHSLDELPGAEMARRATQFSFDVAYFGRVEPEKGVVELAKAAKAAGKSVLFVGDGSAKPEISSVNADAVFMPWLDREDTVRVMSQCRAVCLPSIWPETWGLIVPEALSLGVPVIVSSRAGSAELVSKYGGGLIFDPGASSNLESALGELLSGADYDRFRQAASQALSKAGLSRGEYFDKFASFVESAWGLKLNRADSVSGIAETALV